MKARLIGVVAVLLAAATAAQAHTGVGDANGFAHGFGHPIGGIDHVLAMVAVGLFAAHLGGRALWLVPLAFVSLMTAGGALAMAGIALPFVEFGIGLSVVVLGASLAAGLRLPVAAAMTLVGFFAVFHGHAHGAEMPDSVSGFEYGGGFVLATATLHAAGIGLGLLVARLSEAGGSRVLRMTGSAIAIAGIAILAGYI